MMHLLHDLAIFVKAPPSSYIQLTGKKRWRTKIVKLFQSFSTLLERYSFWEAYTGICPVHGPTVFCPICISRFEQQQPEIWPNCAVILVRLIIVMGNED